MLQTVNHLLPYLLNLTLDRVFTNKLAVYVWKWREKHIFIILLKDNREAEKLSAKRVAKDSKLKLAYAQNIANVDSKLYRQ